MDENPSVQEFLKKLSKQLESDTALLERLPRNSSAGADEKLLRFLTDDSALLLKSAFCFYPPLENKIVANFGSKVFRIVRRIEEYPHAIAITLISGISHDSNDAYPRKHLSIVISTFQLFETISSKSEFRKLATDIGFAGEEYIFEETYTKPLYGNWLNLCMNFLPHSKNWHIKRKIFQHLECLESDVQWMISQKVITFLFD